MPVDFRILAETGVVLVRYEGTAGHTETMERLALCTQHPHFQPTLPHVFDLRHVTAMEEDLVGFFRMQAGVVGVYGTAGPETRVVYLTANEVGRRMANLSRKSWSVDDRHVFFETDNVEDAFAFIGKPPVDLDRHFATSAYLPSAS